MRINADVLLQRTGDPIADAILELAKAIHRLADTQEKPIATSKPQKATWGIADYTEENPIDKALRVQEQRNRSGARGKAKTPPFGFPEEGDAG